MKKPLTIIILLIIILLSFSFVYFKSQAVGAEDNYFNQNLRSKFASSVFLRRIFALHDFGDGKADYLGTRFDKIYIEVDTLESIGMSLFALDELAARIKSITGKETSYVVSDTNIRYRRKLEKDDVAKIVDKYDNRVYSKDTARLYLLYASRDAEEENLLGRTFQEYGIVIYGDTLHEHTSSNPDILVNYEASTALHEFGHLLGVDHNIEPGCLMNESAELTNASWQRPEDIVTDFCGYEITKIYESTK